MFFPNCYNGINTRESDMQEAFVEMGRVLNAHEWRHQMRRHLAAAKKTLEHTQAAVPWDFPEEGGTGWESQALSIARAEYLVALDSKIEAEKRFKGMKLGFHEKFPAHQETLAKMLEKQAKMHSRGT
jgi:hypothetical protein